MADDQPRPDPTDPEQQYYSQQISRDEYVEASMARFDDEERKLAAARYQSLRVGRPSAITLDELIRRLSTSADNSHLPGDG